MFGRSPRPQNFLRFLPVLGAFEDWRRAQPDVAAWTGTREVLFGELRFDEDHAVGTLKVEIDLSRSPALPEERRSDGVLELHRERLPQTG